MMPSEVSTCNRLSGVFASFALLLLATGSLAIASMVLSQPEPLWSTRQAYAAMERNQPHAGGYIKDLHRRFPSDANAVFLAAEFAAKTFEHERAIALYKKLPKDGHRWELAANLGLARRYRVLARQVEEEAALRRAIQIDTLNSDAHHRLGHLLQVQGRTWDAIPSFMIQIRRGKCRGDELMAVASTERFFRADSDIDFSADQLETPEAITQLGRARRLLFENRNAEAEILLRNVVLESPEIGEAQGRLGRLLVETGRTTEFAAWKKSLPTNAMQHPEVAFVHGLQARHLGDARGAAYYFLQTVFMSPNHLPATVQLTSCLEQANEPEIADVFRKRSVILSELESHVNILRFNLDAFTIDKVADRFAEIGRYWEAAGWMHVRSMVSPLPNHLIAKTRHWTEMAKITSDQNRGFDDLLRSPRLQTLAEPDWSRLLSTRNDGPAPTRNEALTSASGLAFDDVAERAGLNFQYFEGTDEENRLNHIFSVVGGGVGVIDLDLDLWPDLHLAQGNDWRNEDQTPRNRDALFRNVRGTRFVDVASLSGVDDAGFSHGVAVEDYDQDGFPDLYLCNLGANRLFRNLGDGSFEDVSDQACTAGEEWSIGSIFVDCNGDSFPDLYVGNYTHADETRYRICNRLGGRQKACSPDVLTPESDRFYLNLGDGRFRDVTLESGVQESSGRALGMLGWDFCGDGRISLFVANDTSANFLLRQNETLQTIEGVRVPQFHDEGILRGLAFDAEGNAQACMGVASGDINQDGLLDLFITNFANESNTLYVQESENSYLDKTRQFKLRDASFALLGFGTQFVDVNFDGWPDIVAANGHVDQNDIYPNADRMLPQLFLNTTGRCFEEHSFPEKSPYFTKATLGRALATLDWNRDGRMDFVVTHIHDPIALVCNQTAQTGKTITIRLLGRASSRSAAGARIQATFEGRSAFHFVTAGDGYLATNESVFPIYLADSASHLSVEVQWPSGQRQAWDRPEHCDDILLVEGYDQVYWIPR